MVFLQAFEDYRNNALTALAFALLLIFVVPFSLLSNSFVSSGTVIIDYGFMKKSFADSFVLLLLALAFLFFYSVLVCLMVFAVRADFNKVKVHYYLSEKIRLFGLKYFKFMAIFTVVAAVLSAILIDFGVPPLAINILLLLASLPFFFLAQTIVVDEEGLGSSVHASIDFLRKNPYAFLISFGFGFAAVSILQLLEFLLDKYFVGGGFVSLFISLVVLVPFFEALKTEIYMGKFGLFTPYRSLEGFQRMGSR